MMLSMDKPLQASKWMRMPVLLAPHNLSRVIDTLDLCPQNISKVLDVNTLSLQKQRFMDCYSALLSGELQRAELAMAMPRGEEALFRRDLGEGRCIVRPKLPVIQTSLFTFMLGQEGKVLTHTLGEGAIAFGIEFAFPGLYRHPETMKMENGLLSPEGRVWKECMRLLRDLSTPLRLMHGDEKIATSIRMDPEAVEFLEHSKVKEMLCPKLYSSLLEMRSSKDIR